MKGAKEGEYMDNLKQFWTETLNRYGENSDDKIVFDSIFTQTEAKELQNNELIITIESVFNKTFIEDASEQLEDFFYEVSGIKATIRVMTNQEYENMNKAKAPVVEVKEEIDDFDDHLSAELTFDNFVVGNCNRIAQNAALAVALKPGTYNPLFLHSNSGLGKTHLLNAIGNYVKKKFPGKRILYTNAEAFVNDYVEAIGNNTIATFNHRYRSVDVLLIDDIQFIANKEGSMEMFFNIFNTLQHSGKQIVITSDKPPVELKGMENRLVSRFRQGLTVTIDNPEFETAKAILKKKIESRMIDYPIDEEVLDFIASHFNKDVRDLEGAVTTLLFYKVVCGQNLDHISLDFALEAFDNPDNTTTVTKKEATPDTIKETVASYYNLSVTQLTSKSRTNNIITARHIAMYLVRELVPDISYIQIGQEFGGRDHSTIMKACSKVKKKMKQDPNYKTAINDLMERLS